MPPTTLPLLAMLLFWAAGSASAADDCVVETNRLIPGNDQKLVHFTGDAKVGDTDTITLNGSQYASDLIFGTLSSCLMLQRDVLMYQWRETLSQEKYTYEKEWLSTHEDSSSFQEPDGHENPLFPYESETFYSDPITVDGFRIPPSLANGISQALQEVLGWNLAVK